MKKYFLLFLVFSFSSLIFSQISPGDIIITEIMQNPDASDDAKGEYFEVYNTTANTIDLQGWVLSDLGTNTHTINTSVLVAAYGYVVLGKSTDLVINGGTPVDYAYTSYTLGNTDDEVVLSFDGTVIDMVAYDGGVSFPNPVGASMELAVQAYNSVDNDIGKNWGVATTSFGSGDFGTPGATNEFTLSVDENEIEMFSLYPNPVKNGKIQIHSKFNLFKNVQIFTLNGKEVFNKIIEFDKPIDISNLTSGIYILKVKEDDKIATRKLIIN